MVETVEAVVLTVAAAGVAEEEVVVVEVPLLVTHSVMGATVGAVNSVATEDPEGMEATVYPEAPAVSDLRESTMAA